MKKTLESILSKIISIIMIAILSLLLLLSVVSTTYVTEVDTVFYVGDRAWIHAVVIMVVSAIGIMAKKRGLSIGRKSVVVTGIVVSLLLGIYVYQANLMPKLDQRRVMSIAESVLLGIFDDFKPGGYIDKNPHQTGIVLMIEAVIGMVGYNDYIVLQFLNLVVMIAFVIGFVFLIRELLPGYEDRTALGTILFLPFWGYVTYIYGNVPGIAFGVWAMYFTVRHCREGKLPHAISSGLCIMLAVIMKENFVILMMALEVVILCHVILNKSLKPLLLAVLCPLLVFSGLDVVDHIMDAQTGIELDQGLSMLSYHAMGLHEHSERGAGWYDGYNEEAYEASGFNTNKASEIAAKDIRKSYQNLREHPGYMMGFYIRKIASTWNDPTCDSLAIQWGRGYREDGDTSKGFSKWIVRQGFFTGLLGQIMNLGWTPLIFGGLIYFLFCLHEERSMESFLPAIFFIGGFIFHVLVWEAGSCYTFYYMIMLIPYAIYGWDIFCDWILQQKKTTLIRIVCVFAGITVFLSLPQVASFLTLNRDNERYAEYIASLY